MVRVAGDDSRHRNVIIKTLTHQLIKKVGEKMLDLSVQISTKPAGYSHYCRFRVGALGE